ncbi:MAG: 6-phosphogluconolactonase, partial [Acidothermus sp.]|nr:6-phosphogluconolactonase [Acidothermus sp.]
MTSPRLIIHPNSDLLAKAAAARLLTALIDATSDGREAHLVVTGGGIGTAVLAALAEAPARDAVAWPSIHVWWGDERFLPHAHPDRNETGARRALLDHVPLEGGHVHPMPS